MKAILFGVLSAFFFAFTFVLNRSMDLAGGSWIWSASLRYLFMAPLLLVLVLMRGNLKPLLLEMKARPWPWLVCSFVGFVLFYAPISYAASSGPSWLVAGTWQITIISGSLLVPLFYDVIETSDGMQKVRRKIPFQGMGMSLLILAGVAVMQVQHASAISGRELWLGILPVLLASFCYPLGNRKMMEVVQGRLDAFQRTLGMTLASLPFWLALSVYGMTTAGAPSSGQVVQSLLVALSSGVIATVLFFKATDLARGSMAQLAAVEATQSIEVVFTLLGEVVILGMGLPSTLSMIGMGLVMVGMILHSFVSQRPVVRRRSGVDGSMGSKGIWGS